MFICKINSSYPRQDLAPFLCWGKTHFQIKIKKRKASDFFYLFFLSLQSGGKSTQLWGTCIPLMPAVNILKPSICWRGTVATVQTTFPSWKMCHASSKVQTGWKRIKKTRPTKIYQAHQVIICLLLTTSQSVPGSSCVQWQVCSQPEIFWPVWRSGYSSAPSTSDTPPRLCTPQNRKHTLCVYKVSRNNIYITN